MQPPSPRINQTAIQIRRVRWALPRCLCDRCGQPAAAVWETSRTAIDIDLDQPVLLQLTVSVHHCKACGHFFRAQPPFLRPDATYSNRVVAKAVASVFRDGMAFTRVAQRLARDFWVQPSERMIRLWCRAYTDDLKLDGDYQQWVTGAFSGVLCVDEVYQDRLAILLAVDPAAPTGDRLVGYELVHGEIEQADVTRLLERLRAAGITPDEVITDASPLYPTVLRAVWPTAAHQLCLFHETRPVVDAVAQVIQEIRAALPKPPPIQRPMGRFRKEPPPVPEGDGNSYDRSSRVALVQRLHKEGYSLRAIARLTGHSRMTIPRWLAEPPVGEMEQATGRDPPDTARGEAARATVEPPPPPAATADQPVAAPDADWRRRPTLPPPAPWATWEQVHQAAEDLRAFRFLLLRRPEHIADDERVQMDRLLDLPEGNSLRLARRFLEDWYAIPTDPGGNRRPPAEARARWQTWRDDVAYHELAPLRRVLRRMDDDRAAHVLAFLDHPAWEATNNGAERSGRQFRHLQAACFKLRTGPAVDGAVKAWATNTKEAGTVQRATVGRSPRGRHPAQGNRREDGAVAA
jgi:hypothetical protein